MSQNMYLDYNNKMITYDLSSALLSKYQNHVPIIVCLGCSNVLSDMVGIFVADFLKARKLPFVILGGSQHNANKDIAKMLYNKINSQKLLFIDSGLISQKNTIVFSNQTILNDGTKLDSPSICCSTIEFENGKVNLAKVSYKKILKYANIIADSICEYYSYNRLLNNC